MPISSRFVVQSTVILLAVGLIALLGIVGATVWLGERANKYFDVVIEARDTRGAAVELRSALQAAESSQRGFLVTGNEIYLAPYDTAKDQVDRQLRGLQQALVANAEAGPMLRRLVDAVGDKVREMDQTIALKGADRDSDALALLRTNRGKALMDEINVFLSGIVRSADERLTHEVNEQRANATMLRLISIIGSLVIVIVVGGVMVTVLRYAREIVQARDEVHRLNAGLEERVAQRTADLAQARDRAEVLLAEVNHRVANSLAMVASLVQLQANSMADPAARNALGEAQARIYAIALVHRRLYSSGDVRFVQLDEYLSGLLEHLESAMRASGHGGASLNHDLEPMKLRTDSSVNLGVVVTEWVTNAFKYAYPDGRGDVRVRLRRLSETQAELAVEDDGVGRRDDVPARGTGLGTRVVRGIAQSMQAKVEYARRQPGTAARLTFPLAAE